MSATLNRARYLPYDEIEVLIRDHLGVARHWAWQFYKKVNQTGYDFEELYSDALFGLFDASRRWDPNQGAFISFAIPRVKGEILEGIRRSAGRRREVIEKARYAFFAKHGRFPSEHELAAALDFTVKRLRQHLQRSSLIEAIRLDQMVEECEDGEVLLIDAVGTEDANLREVEDLFNDMIDPLGERMKAIMRLRFEQDWTLEDIAEFFDISISRVHQLIEANLKTLRRTEAA